MIKVLELFGGLKIKVSDSGSIHTLDHNYTRKNGRADNRKGKKLRPSMDKYGYYRVVLSHEGIRKTYQVHRLVAMAFIPNPYDKETVNHIDGDKTNNNVSNLEWASQKENQSHKWNTGLANYKRDSLGRFI
jgi:hypothetical protein